MTSAQQQLTAEERTLLRAVFTWARANGFRHTEVDPNESGDHSRCRIWAAKDVKHEVHIWDELDSTREIGIFVERDYHTQHLVVRTVRETVDVLAALGVLPTEFSATFAAGRESALDQDEWRSVFPAVGGLREFSRGHWAPPRGRWLMRPDLPYDWPVAELRRRLAELTTLVQLQQLCDATGLADLDRMLRLKRGSRR